MSQRPIALKFFPAAPSDLSALESFLGRPARGVIGVALRCAAGLPVVVVNAPFLDEGTPFPTTFWLSCPELVKSVSRLESAGLTEEFEREIEEDTPLKESFIEAQRAFIAFRQGLAGGDHEALDTGVAGVRELSRVKCLHAQLAHHLAGGENPIGRKVYALVTFPECRKGCAK